MISIGGICICDQSTQCQNVTVPATGADAAAVEAAAEEGATESEACLSSSSDSAGSSSKCNQQSNSRRPFWECSELSRKERVVPSAVVVDADVTVISHRRCRHPVLPREPAKWFLTCEARVGFQVKHVESRLNWWKWWNVVNIIRNAHVTESDTWRQSFTEASNKEWQGVSVVVDVAELMNQPWNGVCVNVHREKCGR